jgi:hypothetical protein
VVALVGVFLNDLNPENATPPSTINFNAPRATSLKMLSPALGQVFFIGDGLTRTGTGTIQTFQAPSGATRLFLGVPDAINASGPPGAYDDNSGAFTITVSVVVPEPCSLVLLGTGAVGLLGYFGARRRARSRE